MREVGAVRKRLSGDTAMAATYLGAARSRLGLLKQRMAFNGLGQLSETITPAPGVEIHVSSILGQDTVDIYVNPAAATIERMRQPACLLPSGNGRLFTDIVGQPDEVFNVPLLEDTNWPTFPDIVKNAGYSRDQSLGFTLRVEDNDLTQVQLGVNGGLYFFLGEQQATYLKLIPFGPIDDYSQVIEGHAVWKTVDSYAASVDGKIWFGRGATSLNGIYRHYFVWTFENIAPAWMPWNPPYPVANQLPPSILYQRCSWQVVLLEGADGCPASIGFFYRDMEYDFWRLGGRCIQTTPDGQLCLGYEQYPYHSYVGAIRAETQFKRQYLVHPYAPDNLFFIHKDCAEPGIGAVLSNRSYWIPLDANGYLVPTEPFTNELTNFQRNDGFDGWEGY